MSRKIFLVDAEDSESLKEMSEGAYPNEDHLQRLVDQYPNLISGEAIDPASPRRWLVIGREAGIPREEGGASHWSLDNLFVDQDGVPTLVEVKRISDPRIRREVVGQMLDYAANSVAYLRIDRLRARFEERCRKRGEEADRVLRDLLGDDPVEPTRAPEEFWKNVKTNLQAGRIRLLFVADEIPPELQRIVEFLNEQMDPAEVLAVEIPLFAGDGFKALVPRLIGQTGKAGFKNSLGGSSTRQWDEDSFWKELKTRQASNPKIESTARKIFDWSKEKHLSLRFGIGSSDPSCTAYFGTDNEKCSLFTIYVYKKSCKIEIPFEHWQKKTREEDRLDAIRRLNEIEGVEVAEEKSDKRPNIDIKLLQEDSELQKLKTTLEWIRQKIEQPSK